VIFCDYLSFPIFWVDNAGVTVDEQTALKANVLRLRQRKGWTQRELAKEAGIHEDVIGKINRMESISDTSIGRLAFALGVDVERFALPAGARAQDHKIIRTTHFEPRPAPVGCALC